jgi:hypothetical protein
MGRFYNIGGKQHYGEFVSRIISSQGTWAAATNLADIQLDKDLLLTNLTIQANMTVTGLAATATIDAPKRVLNGITIVGDGTQFYSLPGGTEQMGVLLALLNQFDSGGAASLNDIVAFGSTNINQFYQLHPGHNKKDKFDLSACIPARALSNLVARLQAPAAAVTDSGAGVITAGTYTLEISGVQGVPVSPGMYYPGSYVQTYPHTVLMPNYSQLFDIPTGAYVRRLVLLTVDNTAVAPLRADTQVTGVQVTIVKDSKPFFTKNFAAIKFDNSIKYGNVLDQQPSAVLAAVTSAPAYYGAAVMPRGFAIVDFRDYFDPILGLNMRYPGVQQGDTKVGLTVGVATGITYLYWDLWYPPKPEWIGIGG